MKHYAYFINGGEIVYTSLSQEDLESVSGVCTAKQVMPRHYKIVPFFVRSYKESMEEIARKVAERNEEMQEDVVFECRGNRRFVVWTDLSAQELERIDGVSSVFMYAKGKYSVSTDPRYSVQDIQESIREVARSKKAPKKYTLVASLDDVEGLLEEALCQIRILTAHRVE